MKSLIIFNKPCGVICQFSPHEKHPSLKDHIDAPGFYPAGRLDTDSEGLLLLTNDGQLQARITQPRFKVEKPTGRNSRAYRTLTNCNCCNARWT